MKCFKFPLLGTAATITCFFGNHGNIAWQAGITIIASELDGQGKHVEVAQLLGKDSYGVLANTAQLILNYGISYLNSCGITRSSYVTT
jgi:hypothetical protein